MTDSNPLIEDLADLFESMHRGDSGGTTAPSGVEDVLSTLRSAIARQDAAASRHLQVVATLLDRLEAERRQPDRTGPRQRSLCMSCPAGASSTGRFYLRNEFNDTRTFVMAVRWTTLPATAKTPRLTLTPQQSAIACGFELAVDYTLDLSDTGALPGAELGGVIEVIVDGFVRATIWLDAQVTSAEPQI
ncbi:MAG: hypothetical protein PVH91_00815 [Pseudomonadales bacterium]|jgi:hypothetical protein